MNEMAVSLSAPCDLPEVSRAAEKNIPGKKYECKSCACTARSLIAESSLASLHCSRS